jgi:MoaA/NifB/PqqE/SkfB family radical SAM enzyme
MGTKDAKNILSEAIEVDEPGYVSITGGEPLLYVKRVVEISKAATDLGYKPMVFTNCFWAKTPRAAYKMLFNLKKAGIKTIITSADVFHQEYVPIEYVCNAVLAAKILRFKGITVASEIINNKFSSIIDVAFFNEATRRIAKKLSELTGVNADEREMRNEGRAKELVYHEFREKRPEDNVEAIKFLGKSIYTKYPEILRVFYVDYLGFVYPSEVGFAIGNAKEISLKDIITCYDSSSHPIIVALKEKGVKGLLEVAEQNSVKLEKIYFSAGELIRDLLLHPKMRRIYSIKVLSHERNHIPLLNINKIS